MIHLYLLGRPWTWRAHFDIRIGAGWPSSKMSFTVCWRCHIVCKWTRSETGNSCD